jgi:cytochrome b561
MAGVALDALIRQTVANHPQQAPKWRMTKGPPVMTNTTTAGDYDSAMGLPPRATDRYSRVARWLHWTMALLLIGNLAGGLLHDVAPEIIMPLHKATGMVLLALVLIRFGWRLAHRPPALPASMPTWEKLASQFTHLSFYALMILIPVSGWVMASAGRWPISFFGLFDVPKFAVERGSALAGAAHEGHEILGFVMIGLIVLHIGAALRHRYVLKDGILARMWG